MPANGTVVVSGASSGIGEATARTLAEAGFAVLGGVRRAADAERVEALHDRVTPVTLDVTESATIDDVARTVGDRPLSGLVNNAGISVSGPLEFVPLDEWRRQLEVNVLGQVAVTQALLPALRRARGRIVNVGSVGGRVAAPLLSPYAASKFALEGISDSLRRELRPLGVHVAIVEPGAVATRIWEKGTASADELLAQAPPEVEEVYGRTIAAMRRQADEAAAAGIDPGEVARAIEHALTAARPRSRYPVGRDAKQRIRAARILPDRAFDALVARIVGI